MKRRSFVQLVASAAFAIALPLQLTRFGVLELGATRVLWGQSIVERLAPLQVEINRLLSRIQRDLRLTATR